MKISLQSLLAACGVATALTMGTPALADCQSCYEMEPPPCAECPQHHRRHAPPCPECNAVYYETDDDDDIWDDAAGDALVLGVDIIASAVADMLAQ